MAKYKVYYKRNEKEQFVFDLHTIVSADSEEQARSEMVKLLQEGETITKVEEL